MKPKPCEHLSQVDKHHKPNTKGCEECMKIGDTWVHLRVCLTCGKVGCCDSSKNKHATKHFHSSNHPMVRSSNGVKTGAGATSTMLSLSLWAKLSA